MKASRLAKNLALGAAIALVLTACTQQDPPRTDWTLAPATASITEREFLVTIPGDASVEETAAALGSDYDVTLVAEWPIGTLGVHCFVFRVPDGDDLDTKISDVSEDSRVVGVQPMNVFETLAYNDELVSLQHAPTSLEAFRAHRSATGKSVRVALIDTGVDRSHPDLEGGIVDVRDFIGDGSDGANEVHGTALAGVISARANNGMGIVGIAPDAEVVGLRGCWQDPSTGAGRCTSFTLARAINVAVSQGFDVINMSLQGPYDPLLAEIVEVGVSKGQTIVVAYDPDRNGDFPASEPGVIAVADKVPEGVSPVLLAPGIDILTTFPGGRYDFLSGSSLSSAHVAGVSALLLERQSTLSGSEIKDILVESSLNETNSVDACVAVSKVMGADDCV